MVSDSDTVSKGDRDSVATWNQSTAENILYQTFTHQCDRDSEVYSLLLVHNQSWPTMRLIRLITVLSEP